MLRACPFRAARGWLVCAAGEVSSGLLHSEAARSSCTRSWISVEVVLNCTGCEDLQCML